MAWKSYNGSHNRRAEEIMKSAPFGYIQPEGKQILHVYKDGYRIPHGQGYVALSACGRRYENKAGTNQYRRIREAGTLKICGSCLRGF